MLEFADGNEMVAEGALAAGCDFFAGYPITPATPILVRMLRELPARGGVGIEAEDEIAALGFCIGASLAGRKAMTATSGPGMSLFSENLGLALFAEIPLVIVDVQRQGPATGSATAVAQGDVQFVRWGTAGGLPMVVLCPTTAADCYTLTVEAFNLAETLRTPVVLLSDKEVATTRERVDLSALERPARRARAQAPPEQTQTYRFEAPAEIPPFVPFDGTRRVRVTGSSHDDDAYITGDAFTIGRYVEHLQAKIEDRAAELERVAWDAQEGARTLIVGYGVTARSARAAVRAARRRGERISLLVLHSLWPLPRRALERALEGIERVIVPELNPGLYRREIERVVAGRTQVVGVNRMDTRLISPDEILRAGVPA